MQEELLTGIFKAVNSLSDDIKELKLEVRQNEANRIKDQKAILEEVRRNEANRIKDQKAILEEVRRNEANRIKDQKAILEEVRRNEKNRQRDKKEMEKMFLNLQQAVEYEIEDLKVTVKKHDIILEKNIQAV